MHYIIYDTLGEFSSISNACAYFILLDSKTVTSLVGDLIVLEDFIVSEA
jgi:hypothetical protein